MSTESEFVFGEDRRAEPPTIEPVRTANPTDPFKPIKRMFAGVWAVVAGMLSGVVQSNSAMIQSVETASGQAMVFNAPDAAFWWSLAWLGVGMVLMMYATAGGRA